MRDESDDVFFADQQLPSTSRQLSQTSQENNFSAEPNHLAHLNLTDGGTGPAPTVGRNLEFPDHESHGIVSPSPNCEAALGNAGQHEDLEIQPGDHMASYANPPSSTLATITGAVNQTLTDTIELPGLDHPPLSLQPRFTGIAHLKSTHK